MRDIDSPKFMSMGKCLAREVRAARRLGFDAISSSVNLNGYSDVVLILPGQIATPMVYLPLADSFGHFDVQGVVGGYRKVDILRGTKFGTHFLPSWNRPQESLERILEKVTEKYGIPKAIIGHSIGGVSGLRVLPEYVDQNPDFKLFAIASPINNGEQWPMVKFGEMFNLAPDPLKKKELKQSFDRAMPYAENIITFGLECDMLVPPSHASFPGAQNYLIGPKDIRDGEPEEYFTHTGAAYMSAIRDVIRDVIAPSELK